MNTQQQFGRGNRVGSAGALFTALRSQGVWRAEIRTPAVGAVSIAIPATALRTFDRDAFVVASGVAACRFTFTVLRNPLKTKKFQYTLFLVHRLPGEVHFVNIKGALSYDSVK